MKLISTFSRLGVPGAFILHRQTSTEVRSLVMGIHIVYTNICYHVQSVGRCQAMKSECTLISEM